MNDEHINSHPNVLILKAEIYDIISYMELMQIKYAEFDSQRANKVNELQALINQLQNKS